MSKAVRKKAVRKKEKNQAGLQSSMSRILEENGCRVESSSSGEIILMGDDSWVSLQPTTVKPAGSLRVVKLTRFENHAQEVFDSSGIPPQHRPYLREVLYNEDLGLVLISQGGHCYLCLNSDVTEGGSDIPAFLLVPNQAEKKFSLDLYEREILSDVSP